MDVIINYNQQLRRDIIIMMIFTVSYYNIKRELKSVNISEENIKGHQDAIKKAKQLDKEYHRLVICQRIKD